MSRFNLANDRRINVNWSVSCGPLKAVLTIVLVLNILESRLAGPSSISQIDNRKQTDSSNVVPVSS